MQTILSFLSSLSERIGEALRSMLRLPSLPAGDLLHDRNYRRIFASVIITHFGAQITMLALPLTAATVLNATPTQMGFLMAAEIVPFVLLSLPAGVWLDRVRKLPVYVVGESVFALALATVPIAAWTGVLSMTWLYVVGFVLGCVHVFGGTAAQIVLTQIVSRERLVEAHSKNALAVSGSEIAGPGLAGALIKLLGAPIAIAFDALLIAGSVLLLRGIRVDESLADRPAATFMRQLRDGLRFVFRTRMLWMLALFVGCWQLLHHMASVVQILVATRELGMTAQAIGMCYVGMGVGTILASVYGKRVSERVGPGPTIVAGFAVSAVGWLALAVAPASVFGVVLFGFMLTCFSGGATLIFVNFLSLRQAVTPEPLLGRMTSTMRWLILIGAGPGALIGGYVGEHIGLRASLAMAGLSAVVLTIFAWRSTVMMGTRSLPKPASLPIQG
ncbi:MAG TPA: MFS transporter [Casimicrobium huifangae]|jgi:MFS family permease|uniref:MFS transporter n=1 Tax=Casimicrobium huifangae TaxID=2591109 RepID=UPI001EE1975C|nr:MFS transporter [Casimicrobium huifangae]HOB01452.1 MFS transporter [Casimicrobium huifangae]HQA33679.1 MFS transporter [Casimicrobium huifangae]HQD65273.1 MFS transporter [Casimicrobium huifangae]